MKILLLLSIKKERERENLLTRKISRRPAILEDMSQSNEHTAVLSKLKIVYFGGGE